MIKKSALSALLFIFVLAGPLLAIDSVDGLTEEAASLSSPIMTFGYVVQVFFSLLIVAGLIYLTAKYILPKFQVTTHGRLIGVVDRIGLEPQVSAYILKVKKRSWLIVSGKGNVEVISELDPDEEKQ